MSLFIAQNLIALDIDTLQALCRRASNDDRNFRIVHVQSECVWIERKTRGVDEFKLGPVGVFPTFRSQQISNYGLRLCVLVAQACHYFDGDDFPSLFAPITNPDPDVLKAVMEEQVAEFSKN